jgi:hypothetical protein
VQDFGQQLKRYDVGLFYFSGHGLQIDGKNYLTSIDTSFADTISAKHTSYPLDEIIDYMQGANPDIKILILDACRNNPLPNQYRSIHSQGLAPIHAPKGTIIAFSTSPSEKALDHGSGRNSIYTGSLLNHIGDANITIEDFFKRVRTSVFTLSKGKQISWEHTSLIGNFHFNTGQLVHSVGTPYKQEYVADENFRSTGSLFDEIIEDLKSCNYYTQLPALKRLRQIPADQLDDSSLFLLGRNILQTAEGGEGSAIAIMEKPDNWLTRFSRADTNHVLNGILFEIYFNSRGLFRQNNFKNSFIASVFHLLTLEKYKSSLEFITDQLTPFRNSLFYFPASVPAALAIEMILEPVEADDDADYKLISVKHEGAELMAPTKPYFQQEHTGHYEDLIRNLCFLLCVPSDKLRLSCNVRPEDKSYIHYPYPLKLSKNHAADLDEDI